MHVNSFSIIMKRLNKNLHGDDPAFYRTPDTRDLAAQYLLLYEFSLPYGLDLNNQINVDKSSTRFIVSMENVDAKILRETAERGEWWLRKNAPESMFSPAVGTALMFAYISERNIKSMLLASLLAFFLIAIVLTFVFRSVKFGLFSLIPNMTPAVMTRAERIERLAAADRWTEGDDVLGLPKVRVQKVTLKKKKKAKTVEEEGEGTADEETKSE